MQPHWANQEHEFFQGSCQLAKVSHSLQKDEINKQICTVNHMHLEPIKMCVRHIEAHPMAQRESFQPACIVAVKLVDCPVVCRAEGGSERLCSIEIGATPCDSWALAVSSDEELCFALLFACKLSLSLLLPPAARDRPGGVRGEKREKNV